MTLENQSAMMSSGGERMYNYSKLLGRIKEKNMTQEEFAKNIGINPSTLSGKLNSTSEFRQSEMEKGMMILDLPLSDICAYFFCH